MILEFFQSEGKMPAWIENYLADSNTAYVGMAWCSVFFLLHTDNYKSKSLIKNNFTYKGYVLTQGIYPVVDVLFQTLLTMKVVVCIGLGSSLCKRCHFMSYNHIQEENANECQDIENLKSRCSRET